MDSRVADLMSTDVTAVQQNDSVEQAAKTMASGDLGFLPVVDGDRLVGTITDRDLVVRGLAEGKAGGVVGDLMTGDVVACRDDDDAATAARTMGDKQLRRLPVTDADGRLVGVYALADTAREEDPALAGSTLGDVVKPS